MRLGARKKERKRKEFKVSILLGVEKQHRNIVGSNQGIITHYLNCPMWNPVKNDKIFTVVSV